MQLLQSNDKLGLISDLGAVAAQAPAPPQADHTERPIADVRPTFTILLLQPTLRTFAAYAKSGGLKACAVCKCIVLKQTAD